MAELIPQSQPSGHLTSLYNSFKGCLPDIQHYQVTQYFAGIIDSAVVNVAGNCDAVISTGVNTVKNVVEKVPKVGDVRRIVVGAGNRELERVEKRLNKLVVFLGGKATVAQEEAKDILQRLVTILERVYTVNTLLVKNTYKRTLGYIKSPTTLLSDGGEWLRTIYIEYAAINLTIRNLTVDASKYILTKINAQYKETSNKITLLINDLKNPQKATQMVAEKLFLVKRATVRAVKKGIEVVIDKKHYYDNLQKFSQFVIRTLTDVLMDLEEKYDLKVSQAKDLYESTVRDYKIQKILLQNQRSEEAQEEKGLKRREEAPTCASGVDERSSQFQTPKAAE